jgi:signal transduction histidine kinase
MGKNLNNNVSELNINSDLGVLKLFHATIDTSDPILHVYDIFGKEKGIPGIIVLKKGQVYGLLSRMHFFEVMSKQFMYDLFSRRKVGFFLTEEDKDRYLILPSSTTIISATNLALQREESDIFEPIIVQCTNNEYKILDFFHLIVAQNNILQLMNNLLKEANEFKQEVLAIVAHDLRNPIGTILGFSQLIKDYYNDVDKTIEYAGHINTIASQMEDMVKNFLMTALNNSTEFQISMAWFDILELINSIVFSLDYLVKNKNQTLKFHFEPNNYDIFSDKLRIKEVIENLITNAIKYSEKGKEILVKLSKSDGFIIIAVKDQGPGFSNEDLEKIYGKFQRLSARPTANESSSGLGLFITKQIIDRLKGIINLESTPGEGSKFSIKIPILNDAREHPNFSQFQAFEN